MTSHAFFSVFLLQFFYFYFILTRLIRRATDKIANIQALTNEGAQGLLYIIHSLSSFDIVGKSPMIRVAFHNNQVCNHIPNIVKLTAGDGNI